MDAVLFASRGDLQNAIRRGPDDVLNERTCGPVLRY